MPETTTATEVGNWTRLILTSPVIAALATALIGALITNYIVNVFKENSAIAERKLQRQTDLASRQFETIQKLIDFEAEYYIAAEFALFNLIERRQDIKAEVFETIAKEYDLSAKSFITNGYKAIFAAEVYLGYAQDHSQKTPKNLTSSPADVKKSVAIFESILKTEAEIAKYICKHDKAAGDFPKEASEEGQNLRDTLRSQHRSFVSCLSQMANSTYHPTTP